MNFIRTYGRTKSRNINLTIMENNPHIIEKISKIEMNNEIELEVGFGNGENLLHRASLFPNIIQVGVDVYKNGICKVLKHIDQNQLQNIKLINKDVRFIFQDNFQISNLYILFPDPWHKKSEVKRNKKRLVNEEFLGKILKYLKPNGFFVFGTDHKDYYENVKIFLEKINQTTLLEESENKYPELNFPGGFFVQSNYEKKAKNSKHYMVCRKI